MSEWRECKLADIADIQTGPFGSQLHVSDYVAEGIPSIMPANVSGNMKVNTDGIARIRTHDAMRLEKYLVDENDIVYSRRVDVEKCAFITSRESGWLCGTGCLRVRFTSSDVLPKYCAYYLSTDEIKGWVSANAVGSTMPNLNTTILGNVPVRFPSLPTQRAIAEVLSSLDNKIDLLTRQNVTLEALAQTYFRQWFVEEADEIWREDLLSNYVDVTRGASPRPIIKYVKDGVFPWVKIGDATASNSIFINSTKEKIIQEGVSKSVIAKRGDIILSNSATCGLPYIMGIDGCVHDGWLVFRNFRHLTKWYVYFLLQAMQREITQQADGTVQDNLNTTILKNISIRVPDSEKITIFDELAEAIIGKIEGNNRQITTLQKLRDTLLPKLVSGEVRIKE